MASRAPRNYGSAMRKLQATEHKVRQLEHELKATRTALDVQYATERRQRHRIEELYDKANEATTRAENTSDRLIMANGEIDRLREAVTSISRLASVVGDASRDGRPHGADQPYPRRLRSTQDATSNRSVDEEAGERDLHYPTAFACGLDDIREEGF